jgi:hypothetical protein
MLATLLRTKSIKSSCNPTAVCTTRTPGSFFAVSCQAPVTGHHGERNAVPYCAHACRGTSFCLHAMPHRARPNSQALQCYFTIPVVHASAPQGLCASAHVRISLERLCDYPRAALVHRSPHLHTITVCRIAPAEHPERQRSAAPAYGSEARSGLHGEGSGRDYD